MHCLKLQNDLDAINGKKGSSMSLPCSEISAEKFQAVSKAAVENHINAFLQHFEKLRYKGPAETDRYEVEGRENLVKHVRHFVEQNKPIMMVLPAFPCKSSNSENKVFGILPDRGEELALQRLDDFCEEVYNFYPPGCNLLLMSDGRVFADLVQVPDQNVEAYGDFLRYRFGPFRHITFDCLDNHVPPGTPDEVRSHLVKRSGLTEEELEAQIDSGSESWHVYAGFITFLEYDLKFDENISNRQKRKRCADIARQMMVRNIAFSRIVTAIYPNHLRLSIHSHCNSGPKYGILLLAGISRCATPWHNVIVEYKDGHCVYMKKVEAEELQKNGHVELVLHPVYQRPWYFKEI